MAPVTKKRTTARAKSARAAKPQVELPKPDDIDSLFPSSKKDKRAIKHSSFVSKIEKTAKTQKRRRPNKKLVATLESLADALPDLGGDEEGSGEIETAQAKIQRKSLKSRPGAMKRKEKLEKMERDRFNKNLAQMAQAKSSTPAGAGSSAYADRWAALKSHVQSTMEVKPEFVKK
ncbi:hypothetical protein BS50DRAFT_235074 [Corynespora cassiicola Philippines]|uniref:Ribosome biogenesis protein SLX9 n=1 Tax=Corynespora cassiicola Philippines TaxID=1448308 RepID=A0A2T2P243_CORCC|nr:hypothetical protein BS50DRAFT_235074 [Corynespora cassiicola Philippines]